MDFCVRIAEKNILIHSVYSIIHGTCKDYLVDTNVIPDIEIRTDEEMLEQEANRLRKQDGEEHGLKTTEDLLVHRLIAESFLDHNTILMHGAVVSDGKDAYMFTAKSGTGKTTHIQKWLENVPCSFVVNGDKPLIILKDDGAYACGTPWCGKEHYGTNTVVPLKSIVLMERSNENRMEQVPLRAVFTSVLQQIHQPTDADKMRKALALLMKLKEHVTFYKFYFDNYREDCFQTSYKALTKNQQ